MMKTYYFIFSNDSLLLEIQPDGSFSVPFCEEPPIPTKPWTTVLHITPLNGMDVKTYSIDNPPANDARFELCSLRQSYYKLPFDFYLKAGKCYELLYWDKNTKFCGICGGTMKQHTDISKRCEHCGKEVWPQLAPAVIVRITRGDQILLARGQNFRSDFYGLIAGFVETGETLEQAVEREVMEETGLKVRNIRYFGSQPWPYPCGLMIGFTADYLDGQIHVQHEELKNAAWFSRNELPNLPEKLSIARWLIDDWLQSNGKSEKNI